MPKLYEIAEEIESCIDYETGEVNSEKLAKLLEQEEKKLEGIGKMMKCLKAEDSALDEEIKVLQNRKRTNERTLENVARFVGAYLGGEKRTVGTVKFMFLGKQEGKINLLVPPKDLPKEYRKENISFKENVTAIREAIASGIDLGQYVQLDSRPKASVK